MRMRSNEMGMDSLIAVDLRSWFLKNLLVSIPVLEILGGISVSELVEQALAKIPAEFIPNVTSDGNVAQLLSVKEEQASAPSGSVGSSTPVSDADVSDTASSHSSDNTALDTPLRESPPEVKPSPPQGAQTPALVPPHPTGSKKIDQELLERSLSLSHTQSMFWVVNSLLEDKTTLNHTGMYRVTGRLRPDDLKTAVRQMVRRHEGMRTCFYEDEDGQVLQGILKDGVLELEHKHVGSDDAVDAEFQQMEKHVHDLAGGRFMRILLLTRSPTESYLIVGTHHIGFDGMCVNVLLHDLEAFYSRRHGELLPQVLQYPDFAERQRAAALDGDWEADLAFWRREFAVLPEPLPLTRARITTRKPLLRYAVHRSDVRLDASLAARIRSAARKCRATAFHFYLAAFRILLQRLILGDSAESDVCIGIADANRRDEETLASFGPYVNLLALRFEGDRSGGRDKRTFAAAIVAARDKTYAALAHATAPFDAVLHAVRVTRDPRLSPLFQTFVDYRQGARERQPFADCQLEAVRFEPGRTAYDLSLDIIDNPGPGGDALVSLFGQTALYSEEDVRVFAMCYEDILREFAEDPDKEIVSGSWRYRDEDVKRALELGKGAFPLPHSRQAELLIRQVNDRREVRIGMAGDPVASDGPGCSGLEPERQGSRANRWRRRLRASDLPQASAEDRFNCGRPYSQWRLTWAVRGSLPGNYP